MQKRSSNHSSNIEGYVRVSTETYRKVDHIGCLQYYTGENLSPVFNNVNQLMLLRMTLCTTGSQRADERRLSSLVVGHDEHLAALQATKLNIAAKAGLLVLESPSCWRR